MQVSPASATTLTLATAAVPAAAAPIEGDFGINAAVLLGALGVWALWMGVRNLYEMRHKRVERRVELTEIDEHALDSTR